MTLKETSKKILSDAIQAIHQRGYYYQYPELPKFYSEDGEAKAKEHFSRLLNTDYPELLQSMGDGLAGEEVSPFLQVGLGIKYPTYSSEQAIQISCNAFNTWQGTSIDERAEILIDALERIKNRFFDIAVATMHTTGQSFMMSFQASGPHANDRALECVAMAYEELTRFPSEVVWSKPMGKYDLTIQKTWKPISKGIGLVIGCSTFPVWNTVPGLFANLITGNTVIVKPHPKAVLPIAIVVAEIQNSLKSFGKTPDIALLVCDTSEQPVTKQLAEHRFVRLIDYTGNSTFGNYIESLPKTTFTEKAGVNSMIVDSIQDLNAVVQNIAFSVSLYSGQMCTAPQNIFVPSSGVKNASGENISFDSFVTELSRAISGLAGHPKAGPGTLGAVQSDLTLNRVKTNASLHKEKVVLEFTSVRNEEFTDARTCSPLIVVCESSEEAVYQQECFGPIIFVIKTRDTVESVALAKDIATKHGSISCGAYCTDEKMITHIAFEMNRAYTPVSFNYTGAAFINQNAAFSDFHVTGGNPSGNASFTNPEYIVKRFVWVGNRFMS